MSKISNIIIKKINGWRKIEDKSKNILWIKGIVYNFTDLEIIKELNFNNNSKRLNSFINKIDGHFAFIFKDKYKIISVVDRVGSIPLFYLFNKSKYYITPFPSLIKKDFEKKLINYQVLSLSMSGYTIGEESIYQNFKSIKGGFYTLFNLKYKKLQKISYNLYEAWKIDNKSSYKYLKKNLNKLNLKIIKKLYQFSLINKKKIAIPLSAGYDSRFIVSCLKELGAKNVFCYSYGLKDNYEAKAAKKIANKLGYEWYFVELNNLKIFNSYRSKNFSNFSKISDTFCSSADFMEFYVIEELHKKRLLKNCIIVNGNSGDFISGAHIPEYFNKGNDSQKIINSLTNAFINKHFKLWNSLATKNNNKIIYNLLIDEIKNLKIYKKINKNNSHSIFEFLEFYNRQSKHVCSRQRIYEYFNYQWALPLWDKDYIDFWKKIRRKFKFKQKLYEDVLIEENYANVWSGKKWKNLKSNIIIVPKIFRYFIRPLAKLFFVFIGRSAWHKFETRYILYFTDFVSSMGITKYQKIINDNRGFRNSLSFHTEYYLKKKLKKFGEKL